ncbi:MAG TPA: efflux RND transporter periplasmic adaptor subunit [Burkholderiales bacterium]|nr:efflux RND transporter periplasmic adaptor subunit [Burkholderiales bacterium]
MEHDDTSDEIRKALARRPGPGGRGSRFRTIAIVMTSGVLVLVGLLGIGLIPRLQTQKANADIPKDNHPIVNVIPATRGNAASEVSLPGTLLPYMEAPIYARTNGYVKKWYVDIGAKVGEGQLLAEIDTPEVDRELKQAIASADQVKAHLELDRTSAERWQGLLARKGVSQQEVDEKVGAYEARKADYAAALANVQRLQEMKQFQRVVAPFAGTITARNVEVGQLINAGSSERGWMYRLAKLQTLRLYINVPQNAMRLIQTGAPVDVMLQEFPGKPFPGKIVRTAGALDPQSKTLLTEVQVPNEKGELMSGLYAAVRFKVNQPTPTIILPSNTLIMRADGPQVAAVADNVIHIRKVTLGRDFGQQIEIITGLNEKELIVTNPPDFLREGVAVKLAPPPTLPATAAATPAPATPATPAQAAAAPQPAAAPAKPAPAAAEKK